MNIKKGLLAGAMVATLSMTSLTGVHAKDIGNTSIGNEFEIFSKSLKGDISQENIKKIEKLFKKAMTLEQESAEYWNKLDKLNLFDTQVDYVMSFEEFAKEFKDGVSKEVINKAKKIYNQIIKLEKEGKYKELDKLWDELYSLDLFQSTTTEISADGEITFEEFAKTFKKDIKEADKKKARELFVKAIELEKAKKLEEASKLWIKLFEMNIYHDEVGVYYIDESIQQLDSYDFKDVDEATTDYTTKDTEEEIKDEEYETYVYTFEDLAKTFRKDVKEADKKKAKELFDKATQLEKEMKDEEAYKIWMQLYDMDIYYNMTEQISEEELLKQEKVEGINIDEIDIDNIDPAGIIINTVEITGEHSTIDDTYDYTFEEFAKGFRKNLKPEIIKEAKELFEKANSKTKEAIKVWGEIEKITNSN